MSKSVAFQIQRKVTGDRTNTFNSPTETYADSPDKEETVALISGNNTIAVPQSPNPATRVTIIPSDDSDITKLLKWSSGDDGFEIGPAGATSFPIPDGKTSLVINADGPEDVDLCWD